MVETGTGRADRDTEDLGDLGRFAALEVAQHEQRPLLRCETTEAPLELIPIGDAKVVIAGGGDVHGQDVKVGNEAALTRRLGQARADDEAMEPRVESVRIAEAPQVTPCDHQRFLQGILGPIGVAEDPLRERVEAVATNADQVGVGLPVTVPCRLDEIAIHGSVPRLRPAGAPVRSLWDGRVACRSIFAEPGGRPARRDASDGPSRDLRSRAARGMTRGMKVAVSVPNDVFERADRLARATGRSRSDVYSSALREYVARHSPDEITIALDRVIADIGDPVDPFVAAASRRVLESTEW